jgi:hypothetical protein
LVPRDYQRYAQTGYIDDDNDKFLSPLQRRWIHQCIECGVYLDFSAIKIRSCLRQYFNDEVLRLAHAFEHDNIRNMVSYFRIFYEKAGEKLPGGKLPVISKHYALLLRHDMPRSNLHHIVASGGVYHSPRLDSTGVNNDGLDIHDGPNSAMVHVPLSPGNTQQRLIPNELIIETGRQHPTISMSGTWDLTNTSQT